MATTLRSPQSSFRTVHNKKDKDVGSGAEGRDLSGVTASGVRSAERTLLMMTASRGDSSNREWKTSERIAIKSRHNSLRRAKNSTDLLRERSVHQQVKNDVASDGNSGSREKKGTQFTVANIGTNGMIYLRLVSSIADSDQVSQYFGPGLWITFHIC